MMEGGMVRLSAFAVLRLTSMEFSWVLDGKIARLRILEDAIDVDRRLPEKPEVIDAIAQ
jgi:hypothetical protein